MSSWSNRLGSALGLIAIIAFLILLFLEKSSKGYDVNINTCRELIKQTTFYGEVVTTGSSNEFTRGGSCIIVNLEKGNISEIPDLSDCHILTLENAMLKIESNYGLTKESPDKTIYDGYFLNKNEGSLEVSVYDHDKKYRYTFELTKGLGFKE